MLVNQRNVQTIFQGYAVIFAEEFSGGSPPLHDKLAHKVASNSLQEEYDFLLAIDGMRELVDEAQLNNLRASSYTIVNKEWENTIRLKERLVRADKFGLLKPAVQLMGAAARKHPDELCAAILKSGFTTTTDYTGSTFFGTNKQAYVGATQFTNKTTGQLNAARFEAARANLKNRLNAKGRPMGLGRKLLLVVSPTWEATARKILTAELVGGGDTNVNRGTAELEVWDQLGANGMENYWFLIEVGLPVKALVYQEETAPRYSEVTDPNDSYVVRMHEFLWQVYASYNVGPGLPELIYGSDGTVA